MVLVGEDEVLAWEILRLPRREVVFRLALELVRLVAAVGDDEGRGGVGDVEEAAEEDIEPPPANLSGIGLQFIECVAKLDGRLLTVLSPEKLRDDPEKDGGFS